VVGATREQAMLAILSKAGGLRDAVLVTKPGPVSLYTQSTRTLFGESTTLANYAGKVTLIVNVASACGYTPQYAGLERLHQTYAARGFAVLGFPCNDFGRQESGSAQEIRDFCDRTYGVTFPLFEKTGVKAGPGQSALYQQLAADSGKLPTWNFGKYLVGRDGKVIAFFEHKISPEDPALRGAIETALSRTG
jgi:glutathione peroxidase